MKRWVSIAQNIEQVTGKSFSVQQQQSLSGGSINSAFMLTGSESGDKKSYFVKTNRTGCGDMFAAEAKALAIMAATNTILIPKPICTGDDQTHSYIVMEYLDMGGMCNQTQLGEQLAAMHRVTAGKFGWEIDNTIGATHQPNAWQENWIDFWREQRLGFQLALAAKNGYGGELQTLGEKLLVEMPVLFSGRDVQPSMLHGDLWGGNVAGLKNGTPVIFDPAFYYGDREADLAMTYVFGGFTADFYASYENAFALDDGFDVRKTFYNIYHIINHLNLFGGGYQAQAIQMLKQVLSEIG
jgi:fructosamine-3-kinase